MANVVYGGGEVVVFLIAVLRQAQMTVRAGLLKKLPLNRCLERWVRGFFT